MVMRMGMQIDKKYEWLYSSKSMVSGQGLSTWSQGPGMVPQVTVMDMARARVRAIQRVMMATNHGGNSNVRGVVPLC